MKRVIKFRGKRTINGEWVYGSLLVWPNGRTYILERENNGNTAWECEIAPDTIGQFTELHDAQGKEIYEGDVIVGKYGHLHAIRYNKMYGAYTATLLNEFLYTDLKTECSVTQRWLDETGKRVCGNVYDTPEFLKSK